MLNPVPPNEKPSCLNQYRPHVVSWDPPSSQSTQLHSSCGGPCHYVGRNHSLSNGSPRSLRPKKDLKPLTLQREGGRLCRLAVGIWTYLDAIEVVGIRYLDKSRTSFL